MIEGIEELRGRREGEKSLKGADYFSRLLLIELRCGKGAMGAMTLIIKFIC